MVRKLLILASAFVGFLTLTLVMPSSSLASAGRLQVDAAGKGLTLSLSLPGREYRQGSRVTATMTVQNVSHRPISLATNPFSRCGRLRVPQAVVMKKRVAVFPPVGVSCVFSNGGVARVVLKPGQRLTVRETIVLLGPQVRAFVFLPTSIHPGFNVPPNVVATPILTVTLSP